MDYSTDLQLLADQASEGDLAAFRKLQHELQHNMGPMVRRALRKEEPASDLFLQIRNTALRLMGKEDPEDFLEADHIVDEVARSICEDLFRPAYRPASFNLALETVRNW